MLQVKPILGRMLLTLRFWLGYSQTDLVKEYDLKQSHISQVESGRLPPFRGMHKVVESLIQLLPPAKQPSINGATLAMIEAVERDKLLNYLLERYKHKKPEGMYTIYYDPENWLYVFLQEGKPVVFNSLQLLIKYLLS